MGETDVNLRVYLRILRRWWWLLGVGVVGAAVIGWLVTGSQTPIYEAKVKVLVQGGQSPGAPTFGDIQTSEALASSYTDLIKTRPILEQVAEDPDIPYGAAALAGKINVSSPRSLIEIKAKDPDPEVAANIANTVAQTLIDSFRSRQFAQIAQLQASLSQAGIPPDSSIIAAQAATISTLAIVEGALPPSSPLANRKNLTVIMAGLLGLAVAGLLVFAIEYLDDRITSESDLENLTGISNLGSGMPTLGSVARMPVAKGDMGPTLLSSNHQRSSLTESYKFLRTNLEFAAIGTSGIKTLLITSSIPGEGKTTTATNLAISMGREGISVVLLDADLRKPALHKTFGLQGRKGLTNFALGDASIEEIMAPTEVETLRVIPCGPVPPDSTVVLRSAKMKELIQRLQNEADIVILDSPPLLSVTDPMLLVPLVDGVLMVVDIKTTGRNAVKRGANTLKQGSPRIYGTVLNKVMDRTSGYYYHYYYYDYKADDESAKATNGSFNLFSKFPNGSFGLLSKVLASRSKRRSSRNITSDELEQQPHQSRNGSTVKEFVTSAVERFRRNGKGH